MDKTLKKIYTKPKTVCVSSPDVVCPRPEKSVLFEHPRMYLKMKNNQVTCPYCETVYILKGSQDE